MKRILTALCALALFAAGAAPAFAAGSSQPSSYYPISVEEYTYGPLDEPRISKVYQLSLSDDPGLIPTGDFERGGRHFYLLDMIRKEEVGVDVRTHTETVTLASDTNKMDKKEADSASLKAILTYFYSCANGDFTAAGNAAGLTTWGWYWAEIWWLVAQGMSWYMSTASSWM